MTAEDVIFILEKLMDSTERNLKAALINNPNDDETRAVYVDYLKEKGYFDSAKLIEEGYTPGGSWRYETRFHPCTLFSGSIGSGQIGGYSIPSGTISSGTVSTYWSTDS